MASHIEFMKSIIYKPTYTLKKDMSATKGGRRSSQLVTEIIDCIIADIGEEKVLIAGTPMKIKRLYAICSDSGDYADVGWVINAEATRCMNCAETFGIYCYAHHCKSCGNVVCDKCSRSTAHIYELQDLGPLRVCDMCYWGQDPVYASKKAVQQLRDSITAASAAAAIRPSDLDAAAAEQAAYERKQAEKLQREREIKEQKHAEIVRQAMPRLATTLKTDGAAVASSRGPASITPFKPAAAAAIATSSVNTNGESSSGGVGSGAVVGSTVNPMRSASMLSTVSNTSTGDGSRAGPGLGPGLKTSTSAAAPATTSSRPPVANVSNPLRSGSSGSMLEVSSCAGGGAEVFPGHEFGGGGGEEEEEMEMDGEEVSAIVNGRRPSMIDREELETFDRMARARTDKLRSFGPLSLVTPDPGFVIKSKRKDLTKVFINVCSHTAVPYRVDPEPDGGTVPSGFGHSGGNVDPSKQLYLLVGPPLEYQNEKDQSYCILYDILVHPDEIKVIFLDPTGAARKRLTSQALDLIGTYFGEHLDPHAKYPSISNNYKGRDKSGKTRVLPFAVPAKDAFYILEQMHTTPEDVPFASPSTSELLDQSTTTAPAAGAPAAATGAASSGKKRSIFGGKKEADQGQGQGRSLSAESAATAASDSYMDPRMSTAQNSCRDCLASLDSIQQNMDSTMKVTVNGDSGGGDSIWANHNDTLLACGISYFAPGYGRCPDDCPFISLDPKHACYWRCLRAEQCGQDDPTQSIADIDYGVCRSCAVVGCGQCTPGKDICEQCKVGYELVGGDCRGRGRHIWKVLFATLGVLAIIIASWYVGLICSDARNPLVLKQALVHRARASLRDRRDGGDMAFPLLSNLWRTPKSQEVPIGGPGCMLLFSFQFYVLLWVILVIVGWLAGTWYLGSDALVVGTYLAVDTQEMCQAVQWGRQVHDRIRAGKLLITVIIYVLSTFFTIAFSVWHFRKFQEADSKTSTMMDYAAVCTGFPPDSGPQVEEDIQAFIQEVTGHSIVGVSVCWDFAAVEHQVLTLVTNEVRRREAGCLNDPCFAQYRMSSGGTRQTRWSQGDQMTARTYLASRVDCLFRPLFHLIDTVLGLPHHDHDDLENDESNTLETDHDKKVAAELFQEIANTGTAFVVFQTERDRDATVKILSTPLAPLYKGRYLIRATAEYYDPQAVCWSSFSVSSAQVVKRMCLGVVGTFVAIVIWGLCFYAPYAYFEAESYAATGEPPSFSSEVTFSMLVVIGNQIMYFFCSAIAERVGFRSKDHVQEAYVLLYTGAVLVNTLVDLGIVVCTTYMSMVARGVRTADGVLLKDLSNSTAVFESYPMMKVFGRTLYEYNFPSCFLIPFIAEAIFTVCLPYHIGYRLVRARSLSRQNAESCLQPIPMDLARYGDIVVNIILSTVCFYTASGWILKTFVGLLIGNVFVYIFDHYRVLRQVENFYLASGAVDAAVQRLLCLPCAVLATAVVFQLYAIFPTSSILSAQSLALLICETFLLHILLHLFLMAYALKHFGKVNHETTDIHYDEVARDWPGNWFTSNPVHCLRSLHLHEHTKPCVFYIKGKEAYLQMDEVQGLYFKPLHRNPADEVF